MIKKLLLTASLLALTSSTFAMQINIKLANDIYANNDKVNLAYDVYTGEGPIGNRETNSMALYGVELAHFGELMTGLNSLLRTANPVDSMDGKHSQVTLGYQKIDRSNITPASCQNIPARPVMNIELSEAGCTVS